MSHVDIAGDGPAVVLLHGQPGCRADWAPVAARLAVHHTVIAPDRPGWGDNPAGALGFSANADAIVGLLDDLGQAAVTAVGHSWGAGVALSLAQRYPDRVGALVLVAPVVPGHHLGLFDRALAAPLVGPALSMASLGGLALAPRVPGARWVLRQVEPGLELMSARSSTRRSSHLWRWRSFTAEQRALFAELGGLAPGLAELAMPVTIVMGGADRLIPPRIMSRLVDALPQAAVVEVAAGHVIPLATPEAVEDAVVATEARAGV